MPPRVKNPRKSSSSSSSSTSTSTSTDPTNPSLAAEPAPPTTSTTTPPASGFSSPSAFNDNDNDDDDDLDAVDCGDAYDSWAHEDETALPPSLPLALPPSSPHPSGNPGGGKHTVATLVNPWSRLNWGITLGSFVYALTSTFLSIPMGFYIVQDLEMDGTALNVVSTMMVRR